MGKAKLPKLLGIGAQKAGTSWLHSTLGQHSEIWVPPFKELHFFDHKFVPSNRKWTEWHIRKGVRETRARWQEKNVLSIENSDYLDRIQERPMFNGQWYKHIFSKCPETKMGVDITPEYCQVSREGIEFIKKFLGRDLKVIYIIRNPIDRAVSQLKMNVSRQSAKPVTLDDWLEFADAPVIAERGDYQKYIPRWSQAFNEGSLLLLPYGLLRKNPIGLLRSVESFLGVGKFDYVNAEQRVFASPKMNVPMDVEDFFGEKFRDQCDFIKGRFGSEFYDMC
ncbi:sulfotransferase [Gymnodinialimonas ceratoperidinii]|uniref:Sulfotransferase n=1 Tax=Gymnodinialimonas ceratoperidinii TaxID=2856823 RepID=A0A8F6YBN9_9RHOB|nr:sulfotransferase [Gymnodinialimonas ceratoperidinii]QXT41154.1 sulfotransferase [Gymnodinialimonas ceratoperidinii]